MFVLKIAMAVNVDVTLQYQSLKMITVPSLSLFVLIAIGAANTNGE
jgi:hypothetical protein